MLRWSASNSSAPVDDVAFPDDDGVSHSDGSGLDDLGELVRGPTEMDRNLPTWGVRSATPENAGIDCARHSSLP